MNSATAALLSHPSAALRRLNPALFLPDGTMRPPQLKSQPVRQPGAARPIVAKKQTSKNKTKRQPSILEAKFMRLWRKSNGPELIAEYRFNPARRWRADFAHMASRTLIEVEGGAWNCGRHQRPIGFRNDCEKYLAAVLAGWTVVRLGDAQLKPEIIGSVVQMVQRNSNVRQCIE